MKRLRDYLLRGLFAITVIDGTGSPQVLPTQTGNSGKFLTTDGSVASWGTPASVGGSNTQVQFNNSGVLAGDASFTWNSVTDLLTLTNDSLGTTQKDSILLQNTTAAANNAQQISPAIHWSGKGWKTTATAASQVVDWRADVLPIQGTTNPYSRWRLRASVNSGAYADIFSVDTRTSTTDATPKLNMAGVSEFTFATAYAEPSMLLTNTNSSSGYTTKSWKFGSTIKASDQVESSGRHTIRTIGAYDFQFGSAITSTLSVFQIDSNGFYNTGKGISAGKVTAVSNVGTHAMAMSIGGGLGIKHVTITGDTTLSDSNLDGGVYYCDTTNANTCSGTPSTACSGYTYAQCSSHTTLGCTPNLTVTCSDYNYSSSGSCTGADAACVWDQSSCAPYVNDSSGCANAGWPSGGFCTFTPSTCTDFGADAATCNGASGCSASYSGSCSDFNSNQGSCEAHPGECTWSDPDCTGNYFVPTGDCGGSYAGSNGTCSGNYDVGTCSGTGGTCTGTALCSNLTASGSGVCSSYTGCSWVSGLTIKLPSLAAAGIKTSDISPLLYFKKVNSGAGSCTVSRADSTSDTIEGSTTSALSTQYDKLIVHGRYVTQICGIYSDNRTSCEAQSGCAWPQCSDYNGMGQGTCEAVNGCTYSDPTCSGTVSPNGICSGSFVLEQKWYKF